MHPAMNLDEAVTVTKLNVQNRPGYLLIGWQHNSFEMYLYIEENLWKGSFSPKRLAGFSKNLQMSESRYYKSLKRCLSQEREDYSYEMNSGFFYWKRKIKDAVVLEGFLPVEIDTSAKNTQSDILEVLISINKHLRDKAKNLENKFTYIKAEYEKCLRDTEDFFNLKIEMEKSLCEKYLTLLHVQKSKLIDSGDEDKYEHVKNFKIFSNM